MSDTYCHRVEDKHCPDEGLSCGQLEDMCVPLTSGTGFGQMMYARSCVTVDTGETMPDSAGGTMPGSAGGTMPGSAGGTMPDSAGGTMPGSAGGTMPGSAGGTMPGSAGGTMPGSAGGTTLGSAGGTMLGSAGGTMLVSAGGTMLAVLQETSIQSFKSLILTAYTLFHKLFHSPAARRYSYCWSRLQT
ncbi:hypothetical protein BsWGS_06959 [Bradybaena similaris]